MRAIVCGAGLAGCEAAYQLSLRGIKTVLYEMKPEYKTAAHHSDDFAELVCSNSLRSNDLSNAVGLLKEEMRRMGSLIMSAADECRVPAGSALAVDRKRFSKYITARIKSDPNIETVYEKVDKIPQEDAVIIATGPLTDEKLSKDISAYLGKEYLSFFDAAAPIVTKESINLDIAYYASRYDKGGADYLNCPMDKEQYEAFYEALINAETAELKDFEKDKKVFEGCMPVEEMARRGRDTLLFGMLKPVGLADPKSGKTPYAVVQLRMDNKEGSLYNMVGFQTHLKFPEQKRVFSMIPGLENAEFVRYGKMHRNTYINSPGILDECYKVKGERLLYFAGQMTGVEGYIESAASGMVAGIDLARQLSGKERVIFPRKTALGALSGYISSECGGILEPMNINFGIIENLEERVRNKRERYLKIAERSLDIIDEMRDRI